MKINLSDDHAVESRDHGLLRRIALLVDTIRIVFENLPPDFEDVPEKRSLNLVTVCLQAFTTNLFGALDNIATVWASEFKIRKEDGSELPKSWIGIKPNNVFLRSTFSEEFNAVLREMDDWIDHLEYFRHALAHRIPLYIPPYSVKNDDEARYHEISGMLWLEFDQDKRAALETELRNLKSFQPVMLQSYENPKLVPFHVQMLQDFLAIEKICNEFGTELQRKLG